jgi:membrane protease YdiL (CAAX protease family)
VTVKEVFLGPDGRLRAFLRFLIFLPVFVLLLVPMVVGMSFLIGAERIESEQEWGFLIQGVVMLAASVLAGYVLLGLPFIDRRSIRTMGLWFYGGWGRELGLGLLIGVVLNSAVVAGIYLLGYYRVTVAEVWPMDMLTGLGWSLLVITLAATAEETLFRGYPFQRLIESWGEFGAVFFLSALFGWAHLGNPSATVLSTANTAVAGVLMAAMYLKTRALWVPIGFHISWNYIMGALYSLPVSGINLTHKIFEVETTGPEWLSGGDFGPEGSIFTTIVGVAGLVWLSRTKLLGVSPEHRTALELHQKGTEGQESLEGQERLGL